MGWQDAPVVGSGKKQSWQDAPIVGEKDLEQPKREVVATTDDGGTVYRGEDGKLGFTSPNYATTDPESIDRIMKGAKPADVSISGFDKQTIEQAPIASRAVKFVEGVPFAGSRVDEAAGALLGEDAGQGVRAASGAMQREKPGESLALTLGGAVAGSLPFAAAGGEYLMARGGQTLGAQAMKTGLAGAVLGGAEGAIYGSGEAEGQGRTANAMEKGVLGVAAGGVLGAASPYVGELAQNILKQFKGSDIRAISKGLGISPKAATVVKNALDAGDMRKAEAALNRAGGGAMLADAGQPTRQLLDAAAQTGGSAGRIAADAVDQRVTGASKELVDTLDATLGKPSGLRTMGANIRQTTQQARQTAYAAAYSKPIDYSSGRGRMLEGLIGRVPNSAIKKANELMRISGEESAQIIARIGDDGRVVYETLPDVRQLDYIARALGDVADAADGKGKLGGQTQLGNAYKSLQRNIRNTLKGAVPEYKNALDVASDAITRVKAGELGYSLLKPGTTRETVSQALSGASRSEREAVKEGIRTYIDDAMSNVKMALTDDNVDAREAIKLLKDVSSRANRQKITAVLGKDSAEKLFSELDKSAVAFELRAALAMNSKTAIRGSIQDSVKQQTRGGALEALSDGKVSEAAKRFVQVFTGNGEEAQALREAGIFEEIARALTEARGRKAKAALNLVNKAIEGGKLTEQQASFIGNTVASTFLLSGNRGASTALSTQ